MNSVLNWLLLRVIWSTLRAWQACNPESLPQSARILSKDDFTVVIWPTRDERILLRLRATARTNTVKLSTDVGYTWQQWGGGWNPADAVHFELPGASERARQKGEEQDGSTGFIGGTIDFVTGSMVATLLRLIPGLTHSQALRLLASPSQLPSWIIEQINLPSFRP